MFEQTQQDLKDFHTLSSTFWKSIPDDRWDVKTGTRDKDWTLHQVLAHVLSISQIFNQSAKAALNGEDHFTKGFTERGQFGDWNEQEIERLTKAPPNGLIVQFLQELRIAHETVAKITPETTPLMTKVVQFNRPAPAIDYLNWHLSHAGVIHGAQVVAPLGREPLWLDFDSDFTQRVIAYYLQQWSMSYWADLGPDEPEAINFHINGAGGGDWHIIVAPDGGSTGTGAIEGGKYDLFFENPHIFFSIFTNYLSIRQAMVNGQMRVASDVRDTLDILRYFAPKRPKIE